MVTLPPAFVATRIPGYFLNTDDKKVYSLKTGILRSLVPASYYSRYYKVVRHGYRVSHGGVKVFLDREYLDRLKAGVDSVIKVSGRR